ncbi:MAG TPA: hypothetical protein VMU43_02230 [Candidatus Acidoferrum sp.]|nr:hypothetical protein [Candidatus Acidoferrum sp.]
MKTAGIFLLGLLVGAGAMMAPAVAHHLLEHWLAAHRGNAGLGAGELAHTEEKFEFVANGPMTEVAPLFGASKERVWAAGWNPQFVWPGEETDREGMVFKVAHGHMKSIWVNTALDLQGGRIQYAYVIPGAMATVITLELTAQGEKTHVAVEYDRTALDGEMNAHVQQMAAEDAKSGPEWEREVSAYLVRQK